MPYLANFFSLYPNFFSTNIFSKHFTNIFSNISVRYCVNPLLIYPYLTTLPVYSIPLFLYPYIYILCFTFYPCFILHFILYKYPYFLHYILF